MKPEDVLDQFVYYSVQHGNSDESSTVVNVSDALIAIQEYTDSQCAPLREEIERLKEIKVFLENEVDRLHGGNDKLKQRIAELEGALKTLKHRIATFDDDPDHLLEVIRVALESEKPEAQKEDLDKMFKQWTEPEAQQQEEQSWLWEQFDSCCILWPEQKIDIEEAQRLFTITRKP